MYRVGLWHNVVLAIIEGDMDAADVRSLGELYDALLRNFPKGIAAITVLRGHLTVGSKETNAEAQRVLTRLRSNMLHVAIVIENRGFVAQLLRSVIRTLNGVTRGTRLSIATDIHEAVRVIIPHVATTGSSSMQQLQKELMQAIETVAKAVPQAEQP